MTYSMFWSYLLPSLLLTMVHFTTKSLTLFIASFS